MRGADNRDMMLLIGMSVVWLLALVVLFGFLRRKSSLGERVRSALRIGSAVGFVRVLLACGGLLAIGHVPAWLQLVALVMIWLAFPEGALLPFLNPGSLLTEGGWDLYARMAALTVASSIGVCLAVALLVEAQRFRAHGDLSSESS
jgi:hypothetical protein